MSKSLKFIPWLHHQASGDKKREMPYAGIYKLGPEIERVIGVEGDYDLDKLLAGIPDANNYIDLFILAEAAWRVDTLCHEHPEQMLSKDDYKEAKALVVTELLCGYRDIGGRGCKVPSVPGSGRCETHGGAITDPEVRKSLLLIAYAKMVRGSQTAVDTLINVMETSPNDMARVKASEVILDRVGLAAEQHIQIHTDEVPDDGANELRLVALRKQLDTARDRLQLQLMPVATEPKITVTAEVIPSSPRTQPTVEDDDIIDGEIVE